MVAITAELIFSQEGVPCPPFSVAAQQLGADDERELFPEALRLVREARLAAVMLENVKGLASARFADYRDNIISELEKSGYEATWQLHYSSEYGVPQLRPRFILVALKRRSFRKFEWPRSTGPLLRSGRCCARSWVLGDGSVMALGLAARTILRQRLLEDPKDMVVQTWGQLALNRLGFSQGWTVRESSMVLPPHPHPPRTLLSTIPLG